MTFMFADDVSILRVVGTKAARPTAKNSLQEDINNIQDQANADQISFAPAKTQALLISRKQNQHEHEQFNMTNTPIIEAGALSLLGVTFNKTGTVTEHLLQKAANASKLIGMLRRSREFLSEEARRHVYVALIRPTIEYSSPLFVNAPQYALKALDLIQRRAERLFPSFHLDSLSHRRNVAGLCILYKIMHGTAPNLLVENLKPKIQCFARTTRQTEQCNNFQLKIPTSRTALHQESFLPHFTRMWNDLPDEAVFAKDVQSFKIIINRELRKLSRSPLLINNNCSRS